MIILGLGSNLGDRRAHLALAVEHLRKILGNLYCSRLLESDALLPQGAPIEWNQPFLNMAACCQSNLPPEALLFQIKQIEKALGRKAGGYWAPREIDIDILAMGKLVFMSEALNIPHAQLLKRNFALLPLAELVPEWHYPLAGEYQGKTAQEIANILGYSVNNQLRDTGKFDD